MDLDTKKKIAVLETQNVIALETVKQIKAAMDDLNPMNQDETFGAITNALAWFDKYYTKE